MRRFVPFFWFVTVLVLRNAAADGGDNSSSHVGKIGVILDNTSRIGKEERVAITMALEDFYQLSNQSFELDIKDSQGDPLQAAIAGSDLIGQNNVQAIIGPQTWEETSLMAEIGSQHSIPVLSLADATPKWATENWHTLVQSSPSPYIQMKTIAAIVQSWDWYEVNIIYEDRDSFSTGVSTHLYAALSDAQIEISKILAIPPLVSSSLSQDLENLREGQCTVFIVHTSFPLALHLFETAKTMDMMEKGYVWITTDSFTSLVHSLSPSTINSVHGIIGVKRYFPEIGERYENFSRRFCQKFSSENPHEFCYEPGIFAAQAYDAAWTVALAMSENNNQGGPALLDKILLNNFTGLSGDINFTDHKLAPAHSFEIINVVGKSYMEIGFWSDGQNFSKTIGQNATYNSSMKELGQVFWPGGPLDAPRGWTLPTSEKPLRIGLPAASPVKKFVDIIQDQSDNTTSFQGFSVDLFRETVKLLPYNLPYEFYAFNGSYDDLVQQIYFKKFDAVVGDVTIVAYRYQYAEFTQPYTDPGIQMIVPVKSKGSRAWLFMKPFTKSMWILLGVMITYNGIVLWMLERNHSPELKGSVVYQTGIIVWLACSSLITSHGDRLRSNLSRLSMVVWLFVALILTKTYTANLASILTVERLEPSVNSVDQIRNSNAMVGCDNGSFLKKYLQEALHIHPGNIQTYGSLEEHAEALRRKEIEATFLEVPEAKIFLKKYCKQFIHAGPMYKNGGYGFAFPRHSPYIPSVDKALVEIFENGKLREMESRMLASQECEDQPDGETTSLSPNSFWALFTLTGSTSTIALLVYIIRRNNISSAQITFWRLTGSMIQRWENQKRQLSRRVRDVADTSTDSPNTSDSPTEV